MSKTHFATIENANESDNTTYYGTTLCGLEYIESEVSNNIKHVTCKKCIKSHPKYLKQVEAEIQNTNY